MNFPLEKLNDFPIEIIELCKKHGVSTFKDVLSVNKLEFLGMGIENDDVDLLLHRVCHTLIPIPRIKTVKELWNSQRGKVRFLRSNIPELDLALNGGIPYGSITECVGTSGVGKTQFCLTLLSEMSLEGKVLFIDTERTFDFQRVKQILQNRFHNLGDEKIEECMKSIVHLEIESLAELKENLSKLCDYVLDDEFKFVILDSIAAHVRREFDNIIKRQSFLNETASVLKNVAETCDIPLVVTNHITIRSGRDPSRQFNQKQSTRNRVVPALGNTWAHCVNTRLLFKSIVLPVEQREVRMIVIEKSPMCAQLQIPYKIMDGGIFMDREDQETSDLERNLKYQKIE